MRYEPENVSDATFFTNTWHSDLVFDDSGAGSSAAWAASSGAGSAAAWSTWDVAAWGLDAGGQPLRRLRLHRGNASRDWGPLCEAPPRWQSENHTLWRTVVTGAEDPKLVLYPPTDSNGSSTVGIVFDSMP